MDSSRTRKIGALSPPNVLLEGEQTKDNPFRPRIEQNRVGKLSNVLKHGKVHAKETTNLNNHQQSRSLNSIYDMIRQPTQLLQVPRIQVFCPKKESSSGCKSPEGKTNCVKRPVAKTDSAVGTVDNEAQAELDGEAHSSKFKISFFPMAKSWLDHTNSETNTDSQRLLRWQKSEKDHSEDISEAMPDNIADTTRSIKTKIACRRRSLIDEGEDYVYNQMLLCIRRDECKNLRSLLKKQPVDLNVVLKGRGSLLHEASYKGCCKCIKYLLRSGSYVNLCDEFGLTPLHAAVLGKNYNAVRLLLENNALPNQENVSGLSPCHLGVLADDIYLLHELIMAKSDPILGGARSPFQMAIDLNKMDALAYFLNTPVLQTKSC